MKRFLAVLFLLCTVAKSQSQSHTFDNNVHYSKGMILLNDGRVLTGNLSYDTAEGLLFYKKDTESRVYTPRSIRYFSFLDLERDVIRRYYSLEYDDLIDGGKRFHFFELVEELPAFSVLVKVDPIEIKSNGYYNSLAGTLGFPTTSFNSPYKPIQYRRQDETVFLLDPSGNLQPYLITKYVYKQNRTYRKPRLIHKELLAKYFGRAFRKIEEFSRENNLAFDDRNDFLKIVGYYKELLN